LQIRKLNNIVIHNPQCSCVVSDTMPKVYDSPLTNTRGSQIL
jgi:hypothetical protein